MVTDDPIDKAYAHACQAIIDDAENLSPEDIEKKLYATGIRYYPDYTQPKNLMLAEVHTGVMFDELDPFFSGTDHVEALERFKKIVSDYLSGNFYPSYWVLSGNYMVDDRGYSWNIRIKDGQLVVGCGNAKIARALEELTASMKLTGNDEADLAVLQRQLPERINNLTLASSELEEYLS
ncbi:MAG: hypothetical protein ACREGJ_03235 [Candidatus Saccharimonadales bacterium]